MNLQHFLRIRKLEQNIISTFLQLISTALAPITSSTHFYYAKNLHKDDTDTTCNVQQYSDNLAYISQQLLVGII